MTATYQADRQAIAALLAASSVAVPVFYANEDFDRPEPSDDPAAPTTWLAVELEYDNAERVSFGGTRQIEGRVVFGLWTEQRGGDGALLALLEAVVSGFEDQEQGGAQFHTAIVGPGEVSEPWYVRQVAVPFTRFDG